MESISNMKEVPCTNSKYLRSFRLEYKQQGKPKFWDIIEAHNSVAILLYNIDRDAIILVNQFRPAVYIHADGVTRHGDGSYEGPPSKGITYELCAGIMDKEELTPKETVREEVLEECGYDVPLDTIELISFFRTNVGTGGAMQHLFYAEVRDSMKVAPGGGCENEGEYITLTYLPRSEMEAFIYNDSPKPVGLAFAFMWFLRNKASKLKLKE